MKDSQQPIVLVMAVCKYIKVNNERFSTRLTSPAWSL